ncbi:transposase [Candidatus Bathyarchaeota archaeon]|nr:transposase [Candidatus Bathyarchaeota archaeon]
MSKKKRGFGPKLRTRAGFSVRKRWIKIVSRMEAPHTCPSCMNQKVRRMSIGIWECRKCGFQFAGGAYQPSTKIGQSSARTE